MIDIDIETRATLNVVEYGLYRHAPTAKILLMWYRIDNGPWTEWRGWFADGETSECADAPPTDLIEAIRDGKMVRSWNAAYERVVLNEQEWLPNIPIEQTICLAAWAATFNLPRQLAMCSRQLLPYDQHKKTGLSKGVKYMWDAAQPLESADDMDIQSEYCLGDCESMMHISDLLPEPTTAWLAEYHANEHVNDRGVIIDRPLAEAIVKMKPMIDAQLMSEIHRIAGDEIKLRGPSLLKWLDKNLPEDLAAKLTIIKKTRDGYSFKSRKARSAGKEARQQLLDAMDDRDDMDHVRKLLAAFEEANKAAVSKFGAAVKRATDDDILCGQFVFHGAGQTGRFSSTGVQVHNLKRKVHDDVDLAISAMLQGDPQIASSTLDMTVNEAASELLRPMFIPDHGNYTYWCDWSSIEARMLPWLSGDKRAEPVLEIFRGGGDIYKVEASGILQIPMHDVDKDDRQIGKVATLALGYQGGVGAFQSMAGNYGLKVSDGRANDIKNAWRDNNPWAVDFWSKLEAAAMDAIYSPGDLFPAGRVTYQFSADLLGGTLLCWLPSGNWLAYPAAKVIEIEKFEGSDPEPAIVFQHPTYGPSSTYGGALAENVTQAESASLLRLALVEAEKEGLQIVMHVHDEIVGEASRKMSRPHAKLLEKIMNKVPDWAEGLPLASEVEIGTRYKCPI